MADHKPLETFAELLKFEYSPDCPHCSILQLCDVALASLPRDPDGNVDSTPVLNVIVHALGDVIFSVSRTGLEASNLIAVVSDHLAARVLMRYEEAQARGEAGDIPDKDLTPEEQALAMAKPAGCA